MLRFLTALRRPKTQRFYNGDGGYGRLTDLDETYQAYLNRVARLTLPATYRSQLATIRPSPKFVGDRPAAFPGYSINTPVGLSDLDNAALYAELTATQQQLKAQLAPIGFAPVPPASFHLTLADLIWERAYEDALQAQPDFEARLCDSIQLSFQRYRQAVGEPSPLSLQVVGLTVRPRSLAACFVPQQEAGYQRLQALRRALYQNSDLIALGIEQQYPFTAHVTLGYFSQVPATLAAEPLAEQLVAVNDAHWLEAEPRVLWVSRAELQQFDDMTHFFHRPEFPAVDL